MSKEIISFSNIEVEKQKFHKKNPSSIYDVNIDIIVVSCLISFLLVKIVLNISSVLKMIEKLDNYV